MGVYNMWLMGSPFSTLVVPWVGETGGQPAPRKKPGLSVEHRQYSFPSWASHSWMSPVSRAVG